MWARDYSNASSAAAQEDIQVQLCATPTLLSIQSSDSKWLFDGGTNTNFDINFLCGIAVSYSASV